MKKRGYTEFQAEPCPGGDENNIYGTENKTARDKLLIIAGVKQIGKAFALREEQAKVIRVDLKSKSVLENQKICP